MNRKCQNIQEKADKNTHGDMLKMTSKNDLKKNSNSPKSVHIFADTLFR